MLGQIIRGEDWLGQVRACYAMLGQVSTGYIRLG